MNFGYIIRQLREARNWSQDELAFAAQTTAATISRIENNKQDTTLEQAGKLAAALGMPAYQLIALAEGFENSVDALAMPTEHRLINAYRQLDRAKQQAVLQMIDWLKQ